MHNKDDSLLDLLRIVSRRFVEDRCAQIASSLTFTTLLALVPIITVALAIASAFPVFDFLIGQLQKFIVHNMLPESVSAISTYARQFSGHAARLKALGITFICVTAVLVMLTIDRAFNNIWRVPRPRPLMQRILVYWTVLTVGPLLMGASLSITSYLISLSFKWVDEVPSIGIALLRVMPLILSVMALSLLYFAVPNRPILKRDAFVGGITAGVGFELMKQGFSFYVTHFPAYTLVYGAFAAAPIFLLWIYLSWLVVIGGGVLVAVLPEWREHAGQAQPAPGSDFFDALQILKILWRAHQKGTITTLSDLHPAVRVRVDHLEKVLNQLVGATWVARSGARGWVLSRNAENITVADVYHLFALRSDARVPARNADQNLEARVGALCTGVSDAMHASLADLFSQSEEKTPSVDRPAHIKVV